MSNYPPGMTADDHAYLDGDVKCNHNEGFTVTKLEELDDTGGFVSFEVECKICTATGYVSYDLVKDNMGNVEYELEY
jgi:hypothetical protein